MNILYFIIVLALLIIEITSNMSPRYIFFSSTLFDYLFIYVLHDFILLMFIFGIH